VRLLVFDISFDFEISFSTRMLFLNTTRGLEHKATAVAFLMQEARDGSYVFARQGSIFLLLLYKLGYMDQGTIKLKMLMSLGIPKLLQPRTAVGGVAVVSLIFLCTVTGFAQSLGDIARQERERKKHSPQRELHVYTNEDLTRPHILVPEDQARALAARKNTPIPAVVASEPATPAVPEVAKPALVARPDVAGVARLELPNTRGQRPQQGPRLTLPVSHRARASASVRPRASLSTTPKAAISLSDFEIEKNTHRSVGLSQTASNGITRVQITRGDSLWKLAQSHLGSGLLWHELAELNPEISNPNLVYAGQWISVPSAESRSAKQITVRAGDTLSSVAQAEFGNALAYSCIAHANPQLRSADRIRAGEILILPPICSLAR
jgi:nucleoid-associated protein YgaU